MANLEWPEWAGNKAVREGKGASVRIVIAGILSLAMYGALNIARPGALTKHSAEIVEAGRIMQEALSAVRSHNGEAGLVPDPEIDPNGTGLIGPEYSELMTTVGDLEAKRTTTNPDVAGLIVHLLHQAGVSRGDTVAIGSSGSFPALMIASVAAAKAMGVNPAVILSLGASTYGATDPDFDLLGIYGVLLGRGIIDRPPAAVSLGGGKDIGIDFEPELRERLMRKIRRSGCRFLYEPDLRKNVEQRIALYKERAGGRIAAFINCGGSYANLGTSPLALELSPGLNTRASLPPPEQRGVAFEMTARGVPIVHLLHIKGLAVKFNLPWDPVPLPEPGAWQPADEASANGHWFWMLSIGYFGLLLLLAAGKRPFSSSRYLRAPR